jgi:hypothetical protein
MMQRTTFLYSLACSLALMTAGAIAQENPGQMGTTPQPSATDPANPGTQSQKAQIPRAKQQPATPQQAPTTPTQPQPRSTPPAEIEKPESAVGATKAAPAPKPLTPEPNANAGALSPVQPNADELRAKIEAALRREPSLSNTTISLNISDDTIDITGNANSPKERLTARRIVQSFAGNRKVRERISVAGVSRPNDESVPTGTPRTPNGSAQSAPPNPPKPDEAETANRPKRDPDKHGDASGTPRSPNL